MEKGKFSQPRNRFEKDFPAPKPKPADPAKLPPEFTLSEDAIVNAPIPPADGMAEIRPAPRPAPTDAEPEEWEDADPTFFERVSAFVSENRKPVLVGVCALALILVVGIIAAVLLGGSADPYDGKILNNVTVAGVHVGGMTREEAENAVKNAVGSSFSDTDMVVKMPEETIRLTPADTGANLDITAAVKAAYEYGRTGTDAERQAAYQASQTGNHTVGLLPFLNLDQQFVRQALETYGQTHGSTLTQSAYEMDGVMPELAQEKFDEKAPCQTLVITIGTPGMGIDIERVFTDVLDAYSLCVFLVEVPEAPADSEPAPLDMDAIYQEFYVEPVDSTLDMQNFKTIPGSYGYDFDLEAAKLLVEEAEFGSTIGIPMRYITPNILEDDVLFRDVLGSCETKHTNNENRNTNLKLACKALNGMILQPGEEFSYNNALGKRTAEKGYKLAQAINGGEMVDTIGGGICQGSSTLYYCTLLADLEIVSRTNHSFPSSYIDYGMDATVSWGSPDFKFKNNTAYPIKIEAEVSGGYVKIKILGTDERDYYVRMEYEITGMESPKTVYEEHEAADGYKDGQVLKKGVKGVYVKTYKCKYDKATDKLISREFEDRSTYKKVDEVVVKLIGQPTEPPTEPSVPTDPTAPPTESTAPPTESTAPPTESTAPPPESTAPPTDPPAPPADGGADA